MLSSWLYHESARQGGIVPFHDCRTTVFGTEKWSAADLSHNTDRTPARHFPSPLHFTSEAKKWHPV